MIVGAPPVHHPTVSLQLASMGTWQGYPAWDDYPDIAIANPPS